MALESKRVLPGLRGREGRRGLGEEPLRVAEFPSTLPLVGPRVPRAPCAPLPGRCVPQVKAEGCFSARLAEPSQRLRACVRDTPARSTRGKEVFPGLLGIAQMRSFSSSSGFVTDTRPVTGGAGQVRRPLWVRRGVVPSGGRPSWCGA